MPIYQFEAMDATGQEIKDQLLADGRARWAVEVYPPTHAIVDNCNLRHLWVMPIGYAPPVDLNDRDVHV